ncbi:TetR/AcrR family transcriptional regulator [Chitinophagaceae bacterium MMS25-I14]
MKQQTAPRVRILQTAARLFQQQGYNSTGINQIIAEAGVAKASMYQHFESKEALCIAWLNQRHQYWFDALHDFTESSRIAKTKTLASFDFIAAMNERENYRGCSFLNTLSEISSENTAVLEVIQSHKNDLRNFFREMHGDTSLSDNIYLLFESALIESQLFKSQWPVEQAKTLVKSLLKQ